MRVPRFCNAARLPSVNVCLLLIVQALLQAQKAEIIKKIGKSEKNTGSVEVQVALLTATINKLTVHMQQNKKDFHSNRGLLMMVGKRKSLMDYLKNEDVNRSRDLVSKLGLRK